METTTTKTKQEGTAAFVPIPNLKESDDGWDVGHAGLYPTDGDDIETSQVVEPCITLSIKGGKTLIDCEKGIKAFVKDVLARKRVNKIVSKDGSYSQSLGEYGLTLDDVKHLPDTEIGVWVHYLTKGIIRDFGITWTSTPVSIKGRATAADKIEKARTEGKRVLSKKEKNELIAKRNYEYWEQDIIDGKITEEEADAFMKEARDKVRELQDAGYFVSTRKTEGVALFDWRSEVISSWEGDETKLKIYNRHSIIPVVPCLVDKKDNKLGMLNTNKFVKKEVDKSIVSGITTVANADWMDTRIKEWKKMKEHYEVKAIHIAKINQSGKMRDRWFVVDCIKKADGKQVLLMWDKNGVDGMLE